MNRRLTAKERRTLSLAHIRKARFKKNKVLTAEQLNVLIDCIQVLVKERTK